MNSSKPVIGITGPQEGGISAWLFTAAAVWLQGGHPVRIHPGKPADVELDGLILGGGADINPGRYGELLENKLYNKPKPRGLRLWFIRIVSFFFYPLLFVFRNIFSTKKKVDTNARDELEFSLLEHACTRGIPVLGICRGAQLINVKFGGTLHQDITGFYTEVPKVYTIWPQKTVSIKQGSRLYHITGSGGAWVNALHHQAVDELGDELTATAKDKANIIQAIEHPGFDYLIGVQWHPEYLPQIPLQRALFGELVKKARKGKRQT